jgi:glycosyltransferase involved in cell wall biosynthesis
MNVMIVAEFLDDIQNPAAYNSRFLEVADLLAAQGHEVQFVTTDFIHSAKRHVSGVTSFQGHKLTALHEPGYRKNIGPGRFLSHYVLSKRLKKWLKGQKKPDVIYCAVPSLDFAYEAARYARKNHIKFVVDIQDLWPEAFALVLNIPVVTKLLFSPLHLRANRIYRTADRILAVSRTYVDRALQVNEKCSSGSAVYLGTHVDRFDRYRAEAAPLEKSEGEIWLGYVGTLGYSYDLKTVMDAMALLKQEPEAAGLRLIVAGDGPLRQEFESYAAQKQVAATFTGKLPYAQMVPLLCRCDIAVNPIKRRSAGSIINKHGDYAAAGLPVLNSQESAEYRRLVQEQCMGLNCNCQDSRDMADKLLELLRNPQLRRAMGENARSCALEKFHRGNTYQTIVSAIVDRE